MYLCLCFVDDDKASTACMRIHKYNIRTILTPHGILFSYMDSLFIVHLFITTVRTMCTCLTEPYIYINTSFPINIFYFIYYQL